MRYEKAERDVGLGEWMLWFPYRVLKGSCYLVVVINTLKLF